MGTDKRNRQKENRRTRLDELDKQVQSQLLRRRLTRFAVVVGLVVLVVGAVFLSSQDSESPTTTAPESSSVEPTDTTPTEVEGFVYGQGDCAPVDGSGEAVHEFSDAPKLCIDLTKKYLANVVTNFGEFTIELDAVKAPGAVNNFVNLVRSKYFDGTICHRAIPTFVVQCGDPTGLGAGNPGYAIADELPEAGQYKVGSLAMANAGPNTSGSQFFVITGEQGVSLPPSYSLFGQVTTGLDTTVAELDRQGNPDTSSNGVPPLQELQILKVTVSQS